MISCLSRHIALKISDFSYHSIKVFEKLRASIILSIMDERALRVDKAIRTQNLNAPIQYSLIRGSN
jgi:hypothetical protein